MTNDEIQKVKEELQKDVYERAFYAEGTADFLKEKIKNHSRIITINQYLSLALPLLLGGYASVDSESDIFIILKYSVGVISVFVLLLSAFLIVAKIDDKLSHVNQSFSFNFLLQNLYNDIAKIIKGNKNGDLNQIESLFRSLTARDESNATHDEKLVDNDDKRRVMFNILKKHNKKCNVCKQVPDSFKKNGCNNCGNLKK